MIYFPLNKPVLFLPVINKNKIYYYYTFHSGREIHNNDYPMTQVILYSRLPTGSSEGKIHKI